MDRVFSLAAPTVVSEVIDGEAIIMDVRTGIYHSAEGLAAPLWEALVAGVGTVQIVQALEMAYPGTEAAADLNAYVDQLTGAGLLAASDGKPSIVPVDFAGLPYAAPSLVSHGDMQDLILLDPIHDVSADYGWPVKPDLAAPGAAA
ncbi:PqqD family protein [Sphingomonas naphthae]|uniref:PqqD family protein n=1 Tax=Sphingomonas naphthae TaxID=1813468 RepID=A0ABY7TRV6_9SPHN|nr:PqqD family protein [Sphingomonas naphthae]WCT74939.1 PqqD family protein [Sphingomonas naphthae]